MSSLCIVSFIVLLSSSTVLALSSGDFCPCLVLCEVQCLEVQHERRNGSPQPTILVDPLTPLAAAQCLGRVRSRCPSASASSCYWSCY
ncbi:hypothetical protein PF010_g27913 [Phytophthora fragariae]|uniref:Secreted protein n=1 Tax=Phytophthora fragariae TaxID=53985 RepID=A0A6G0JSK8_9STRA|nr:hypothetical protein PF010_g27913 [Phytophthora fragariae]